MALYRLFHNNEDAMAAAAELKEAGYGEFGVDVITSMTNDAGVDAMVQRGVSPPHARYCVKRITEGAALVIVNAPFGAGAKATSILEKHNPDATEEVAASIYSGPTEDPATPLSNLFGLPVLLRNPTPLSSWLKLPIFWQWPSNKSTSFGFALLSRDPAPLSSTMGFRTLLDKAAPFSSWLGLKTLTNNPAPLSSLLGMPTLVRHR